MNNQITTLSRQDLIDSLENGIGLSFAEEREACRALLAVMDAQEKPLGYVDQRVIDSEDGNGGMWVKRQSRQENFYSVPVYTTPTAPSAPDGWKLVPVKATDEIIQAGIEAHYYRQVTQQPELEEFVGPMESAYNAMLAAAPGGE